MFNYSELSDTDFEELCKDIMQRKLKDFEEEIDLRTFRKGKDGGIDIADKVDKPVILIQAKHYWNSSFSSLKKNLEKEVEKVNEIKPRHYYICVSCDLTPANIKDIKDMFSEYMKDESNIVTRKEIDDFLQKEENKDIVWKHYKLWLSSSQILQEIHNQDRYIDCETLLSDIEEESKYFVSTKIYIECLNCLEKTGFLMITGGPGVGKTITSKMLVLYFSQQLEYRVRYTTNGSISDIKKSLSMNKELKEIILLDDCLGQHYFNLSDTTTTELQSLIEYVKVNKNKKLILNSRITIFNEAKEKYPAFNEYIQRKKIQEFVINMDEISLLEKGKIFYKHLKSKNIPKEYFQSIKENEKYLDIVKHQNFTPRIIDYVTLEHNYIKVANVTYATYILEKLDFPQDIWKNEYEQRIQKEDRVFLSTLYSLTDTIVEESRIKRCYEKRLSKMEGIDSTKNPFESVLTRLNQSMVKVVDKRGKKYIGAINPSVNDYMKVVLHENNLERQAVKEAICDYDQVKRLFSGVDYTDYCRRLLITGEVEKLCFSGGDRSCFIAETIYMNKLEMREYKEAIYSFLDYDYGKFWVKNDVGILAYLLEEKVSDCYGIRDYFLNEESLHNFLQKLEIKKLIETINILYPWYEDIDEDILPFEDLFEEYVNCKLEKYVNEIDISEYCDDNDVKECISSSISQYWDGFRYEEYEDKSQAINELREIIEENILNKIDDIIGGLEMDLYIDREVVEVREGEVEDIIDNFSEEREYFRSNNKDANESEEVRIIKEMFEQE